MHEKTKIQLIAIRLEHSEKNCNFSENIRFLKGQLLSWVIINSQNKMRS